MRIKNLFMLLLIVLTSCGTQHLVRKGDHNYEKMNYQAAENFYEQAREKLGYHEKVNQRLAEICYKTGDYDEALMMLNELDENNAMNVELARLKGRTLMALENYGEAKDMFERIPEKSRKDSTLVNWLAMSEVMFQNKPDTSEYAMNKLEIDGFSGAFSPVLYNGKLFFSGFPKKKSASGLNQAPKQVFSDLYKVQAQADKVVGEAESVGKGLPDKYHLAVARYTNGGKKVFFSANRPATKMLFFKPQREETVEIAIYVAEKKEGQWTNVQTLPFEREDYSYMHPCLSSDGKTLYFASDMPGGEGGMDIYYSKKDMNGWGKPVNMGDDINTSENEVFPFIYEDSVLYFSSEGHANFGGLDVFKSIARAEGKWTEPENMRFPFNSSRDDFGVFFRNDGHTGYVSSNRSGSDHIFYFERQKFPMDPDIPYKRQMLAGTNGNNGALLSQGDQAPVNSGENNKFFDLYTEYAQNSKDYEVPGNDDLIKYKKREADSNNIEMHKKEHGLPVPGKEFEYPGNDHNNNDQFVDADHPNSKGNNGNSSKTGSSENPQEQIANNDNSTSAQSDVHKGQGSPGNGVQDGQYAVNESSPAGENSNLRNGNGVAARPSKAGVEYKDTTKASHKGQNDDKLEETTPEVIEIYASEDAEEEEKVSKMKEYYRNNIKEATTEHPMFKLKSKEAVTSLFEMKFSKESNHSEENFSISYDFDSSRAARTIMLNNIYYAYDKWNIDQQAGRELEKIVALLNEQDELILELSAHTDSRGARAYNLLLSKRRALAAAGYMVSIGIDPERLKVRYCGESHLLHRPAEYNNPAEAHRLNRRTEFRLMKPKPENEVIAETACQDCFKGCKTLSLEEIEFAGDYIEKRQVQDNNYYIISGSFHSKKLAVSYRNKLHRQGFKETRILHDNKIGFYRISIMGFDERQSALANLRKVRHKANDLNVWLLQK